MRDESASQRQEATIPVKLVDADILLNRRNELQVMIARRAYELFERRGSSNGHDVDDWIEAEVEVLHPCRHDLKESVDAIVFSAELPSSFTADQLKISVGPRCLTLSGERKLAVISGGDEPFHAEKRTQRIFQVEELPADVDPSRATVTLKGEILEIVMPKGSAGGKPSVKAEAASSGR